jgi:cytochrome c oxidase subunit 3
MSNETKRYNPTKNYFIAEPSFWPIMGSVGLFCTVIGLVQTLHEGLFGPYLMGLGFIILLTVMAGWFSNVIKESIGGLHSEQMDRSYRWGMVWFIVSELFLFGVFFLALFYTRMFSLTELGNAVGPLATSLLLSKGAATHDVLWPNFTYVWPLLKNPNPTLFPGPTQVVYTWEIPAINTLLLLSSAVTITWAHWALKKEHRNQLLIGLFLTIALGTVFECFQVHEYIKAYTEYNLTLHSGIYGSTFFMLTGLHAFHVTVGVIMIAVIFVRTYRHHFLPEHHFAFEAVSWYWHMVDVVWLFLFIFVYWL